MTPAEIASIAGKPLERVTAGAHPWLGELHIRFGRRQLWLDLDANGQLQGLVLAQPNGWRFMATRLSPRLDLCSGERSYLLRLRNLAEWQGAEVFVNGTRVSEREELTGLVSAPEGVVQLEVRRPDRSVWIKVLTLEPSGPGERRVELLSQKQVPFPGHGQPTL
jgi:hypothetical protein